MSPVPRSPDFTALEQLSRRDYGGRGVATFLAEGAPLGQGQLEAAARDVAASARAVAIVTGFAVHDGQRYVAETDGPPAAIVLADVLLEHGIEVGLLSDTIGRPALEAGCQALGFSLDLVHELPFDLGRPDDATADLWIDGLLASDFGRRLTHVICIERVGPSHTLESVQAQTRQGPAPVELFQQDVPPEHRNVCHNMRGMPIDACTAPLHRLFEAVAQRRLPITTIGIGDGGNELGMGQFPWEILRSAIAQGPAGKVACRIATDRTIVAGVSNWGGYALAAAVDALRGGNHLRGAWSAQREQRLLETLVNTAGCIDGLTRRRESTVDGLSAAQLAAFWQELLQLV